MGGEEQAKQRGVTKSIARGGVDGNFRFLEAITGLRAGNKPEGGNEYVR
jgi:hypothetical protein